MLTCPLQKEVIKMSITQEALLSWKAKWIKQQVKNSLHPESFWYEIANLILEGRLKMDNNPLVTIGKYAFEWPGAMEFLVERNNRGIELEKNGNIESAIIVYEISVADDFFGTHPYDRLRIFYTKTKWYKDAIRVCQSYLDLPNRANGQNKPHFRQHLEKLLIKQKE
jgi:hypothetical protein